MSSHYDILSQEKPQACRDMKGIAAVYSVCSDIGYQVRVIVRF